MIIPKDLVCVHSLWILESFLNRLRRQTTPALPKSAFFDIPDGYSKTKDGVLFLFSDELVRKKRVILFASDEQLRTLFAATHIMIDATFSACVPQFDQVFSIHCIKYGYSMSSQHCLLNSHMPIIFPRLSMRHRFVTGPKYSCLQTRLQYTRRRGKKSQSYIPANPRHVGFWKSPHQDDCCTGIRYFQNVFKNRVLCFVSVSGCTALRVLLSFHTMSLSSHSVVGTECTVPQ